MTVLVTHRFSTLRMVDRIVVLGGGKVVEQESHQERMAGSGLYTKLSELQARGSRSVPARAFANPTLIQVSAELLAAARVAQLAQRLRLDLADALAGHTKLAADLFQRTAMPVFEAEPKLEHPPLPTR